MEAAIEAPLTTVHEPLFPDAVEAEETQAVAADADGNVAENDEPAAKRMPSRIGRRTTTFRSPRWRSRRGLYGTDPRRNRRRGGGAGGGGGGDVATGETGRNSRRRSRRAGRVSPPPPRGNRLSCARWRSVASLLSRFMGKPQSQPPPSRLAASMMHPIDLAGDATAPHAAFRRRSRRRRVASRSLPGGRERRVAVKTEGVTPRALPGHTAPGITYSVA